MSFKKKFLFWNVKNNGSYFIVGHFNSRQRMKKFFTSLFLACPSSFITHLRHNLKASDLIACMKLNEKSYYLDKNSWSQLQATYGNQNTARRRNNTWYKIYPPWIILCETMFNQRIRKDIENNRIIWPLIENTNFIATRTYEKEQYLYVMTSKIIT